MQKQLLGAHISIAGNISLAIERALSIGCSTMQIFTKSNRSWFDKPLQQEDIARFRSALEKSGLKKIMAHTSYLINIGAKEASTEANSVKSLALELGRAQSLNIPLLVLHPGSHTGAGTTACIKKIAANLNSILEEASGETSILIETMAGQGTNVGSSFEEVYEILSLVKKNNLLGVCFDTCHVFCAGYDISSYEQYHQAFQKFDAIIGINNIKAFHLNGSKTECGSKKDRHAPLEEGEIPLSFFKNLMNDQRFTTIPKVLETPSDDEMELYKKEIALLRSMIN